MPELVGALASWSVVAKPQVMRVTPEEQKIAAEFEKQRIADKAKSAAEAKQKASPRLFSQEELKSLAELQSLDLSVLPSEKLVSLDKLKTFLTKIKVGKPSEYTKIEAVLGAEATFGYQQGEQGAR